MPKYKIIATDLDGTLFNSRADLSEENIAAIRALIEKGVQVVPSSGRTLHEMPPVIRDNPLFRYIIHSDGASIYDRMEDTFHGVYMDNALTNEVLDMLHEYEVHFTVRVFGKSYRDTRDTDAVLNHFRYTLPYQRFLRYFIEPRYDFDTFIRHLEAVEMICINFHSTEEQAAFARRVNEHPLLACTSSDVANIEVYHKEAGKGNGLWRLADLLGVDRTETIAVGDSHNDLSNIQAAGLGLAMGNAWEEVKAAADAVICHNDEHAMQYILEHYID